MKTFYYIDKELEIDEKKIIDFIEKFEGEFLPGLKKLENYYMNKNDIINRTFEDLSKPNNKVAHKFGAYIVDTNTGIFLGTPIAYQSQDNIEEFQVALDATDEQDVNIDLATNAGIFGYAVQLLYLDQEAQVRLTTLNNLNTVLLYSDEIDGELLYAIRFKRDEKDKLSYTVYSATEVKSITGEVVTNQFDGLPVIVYQNNSRCIGDFEHVIPLIDAYDRLESDTLNEQDYFNDCYLYLNADNVDRTDIANMKENRVIFGEGINPQFVTKQGVGDTLENTKNRVVKDIHKLSMTPDLSDENFANNVSGVAMKYKLMGLLNNIANKTRKFKKAINRRNKLIGSIMSVKMLDVAKDIDVIFSINLPQNIKELGESLNNLRGLVSTETLMAQIPFVEDVAYEKEKLEEEQSEVNMFPNLPEDPEDDMNERG